MKNLNYLNSRFHYKSDGRVDRWTLMEPDSKGHLYGDCEDYSLWIAYWLIAEGSWLKLYWMILTRQVKFHYVRVKATWEPHMVLEHKGMCIDNIYRKWVSRHKMEHQFTFKHRAILTTVWIKQLKNLWS